MFHKNYLLKCIKKDNDHSIIEYSYENSIFKYNLSNHEDDKQTSISSKLIKKFNNSKCRPFNLKKVIKKDKKQNKNRIKNFSNYATNHSFLNATSSLFSSTTISGILTQESTNKNIAWEDYFNEDDDLSTDEESFCSNLSLSFYERDHLTLKSNQFSNINLNDSNSSISSLSSLEYEPFENSSIKQTNRKKRKLSKTNFDPLISSSRSQISNSNNYSSNKQKLKFEPHTTSSRRSLFIEEDSQNCLYCCTANTASSFLTDNNICSSTICSFKMNNNSTVIRHKQNNFRRSSSSFSLSSSDSLESINLDNF